MSDERGGDAKREERRGALKTLVVAGSAVFGCALAAPAVVFVAAPLDANRGTKGQWVKTVRLDELEEGVPKKVAVVADQRDAWTLARDVELGAAWLVRKGEVVTAFSVTCPHLGCAINLDPAGKGYLCPCHTSGFDAEGKKVQGPSPRDMDPLATKIEAGAVLVEFKRFRIGVEERVET